MRNATVLVIRLRGIATETIKNIVLAGIGKLIVVDDALVQPDDLATGFFFRDEDVNAKKRVHAAKPHIQSLNPLVKVEVQEDLSVLVKEEALETLLKSVDLVCLTDTDQATAVSSLHRSLMIVTDSVMQIRVNDAARKLGKKFYCGGSFGLSGYIFCDLLDHQYVTTYGSTSGNLRNRLIHQSRARTTNKDGTSQSKLEQHKLAYSSLSRALQHSWKDTTSNATKVLRPVTVFSILGVHQILTSHPLGKAEI
jgi:ubiquitin-like 1-activating enzyme E1 A